MTATELITTSEALPINPIQLWATARTDPTSSRRRDLIRDKSQAVYDFFNWCGKSPERVTEIDVDLWRQELERRGLAHSTVYARISRVSSFFEWAMKRPDLAERIKRNPVDLARPKAPKAYQNGSCKALDDEEAKALLSVIRGKASFDDVVGKRDLALVLLFLSTGMRRAEILNLRWKHLKLNGRLTITTRIKGGDVVRQDVDDPSVLDALLDYLKASGRWGNLEADDPLWTRHDRAGKSGKALTAHGFAANLKRYGAKVGIADIHPHQLRHTSARILEEETGSVGAVQEMLNHRNQATTRVYLGAIRTKKDRASAAILSRLGV
jgi:integrase/recombinase XerC